MLKTDAYERCLRRMCQRLGFNVTNNHAFRMSLNTNVFFTKLGLPVTTRAALLGHSVSTNKKYYSFDRKNSLTDVCKAMNGLTNSNANDKENEQDLLTPLLTPKFYILTIKCY